MRWAAALLGFALVATFAQAATAGAILDRVKARGTLRCGGVERPGLVAIEADGKASGLELDLCRALASVALGPQGRLEFRRYDSADAFAPENVEADDVAFLTGAEIFDNHLASRLLPGPPVFIETTGLMVLEDSPAQGLADLQGQPICFLLGSAAERHLQAEFSARGLGFVRMGFQEEGEMLDAYAVRYCHALAGETTTLADQRGAGKLATSRYRILPEPLAAFPIVAATPVKDGEWAALVAWTLDSLKRADAPSGPWRIGGMKSLPATAPEIGLTAGWQERLTALVGSYDDIYERNLGAKSPLGLTRGPNANLEQGGVFAEPYAE